MTEIKINRETPTAAELKNLYDNSALTMLGYMLNDLPLYINELKPFIRNDSVTVYECKGADIMNMRDFEFETFLPKDLNIFIINLDELKDVNKLAVTLRFERGYRWLDDIINNKLKSNEEDEEE